MLVVYGHIKVAFFSLKQPRIQFDSMGITAALFFFLSTPNLLLFIGFLIRDWFNNRKKLTEAIYKEKKENLFHHGLAILDHVFSTALTLYVACSSSE